jgi:hypothetical protein
MDEVWTDKNNIDVENLFLKSRQSIFSRIPTAGKRAKDSQQASQVVPNGFYPELIDSNYVIQAKILRVISLICEQIS